ncbi:MAG: Asp-tRNA(Asn)/Glu-tRNA(Gln) amidotransferase subunit GatA [Clostridiaceae bacterium]|nr:Asp-tRNA(Asn)/Glu-tRNA(Gln) amidotransferase subunit GatA [Clostridiaceae bacterium]
MNLEAMTLERLKQGYRIKQFSVKEITTAYLDRIKRLDNKINAFIHLCEEEAVKEAKALDERIASGAEVGPLAGIPVAIKDNICTDGFKTTCASKMLGNFVPPYDATVVKQLKEAGAIVIGKTNMDEFAMGSSTENSAFKITRNPWNRDKVPGGSSGGSAAAVAAGFTPLAIGSDTGGSIRQPAAFCGVVGLKPTYGLVSRYGLIAFASSLDQIGPITKTVKDCAYSLEVITGKDPLDSTCYKGVVNRDYKEILEENIAGLKIGVPREFFQEGVDHEIQQAIKISIKKLEEMRVIVEEFSLPIMDIGLSTYRILSSAEASSNLARYDGIRYGYRSDNSADLEELIVNSRTEAFGKEVKRRIMLGTYVLSSSHYNNYYKKAAENRISIENMFKEALKKYDLIISPTTSQLPFNIGEKIAHSLEMHQSDIYTVFANITGIPAISIPCGFSQSRLPIGLQFMGSPFSEGKLLTVAHQLEERLTLQQQGLELEVREGCD